MQPLDHPTPADSLPSHRRIGGALSRFAAGATALLALALTAPAQAESYRVVDLHRGLSDKGSSYARAINEMGQVLVQADTETILYDGRQLRNLNREIRLLAPNASSTSIGINDTGQIVGSLAQPDETGALGASRAFLYDDGGLREMVTLSGFASGSSGINALGHAVGTWDGASSTTLFLFQDGQIRDLGRPEGFRGASTARINDLGHLSANFSTRWPYTTRAFLYDGTGFRDLGTLGGRNACAMGLNDLDQVVGYSGLAPVNGGERQRAFLWDATNGMRDLGSLGPQQRSRADDINNRGQIVGTADAVGADEPPHAVIWENGQIKDLNRLITRDTGWVLTDALAINDRGQIVGLGRHNGSLRAFLLNPVSPRPPTAPALSISVSGVAAESSVEFGSLLLGAAGSVKTLLLSNTGTAPMRLGSIKLSGASGKEFAILSGAGSGAGSGTLKPGASRSVALRFTPMGVGRRSAAVAIRHSGRTQAEIVSLGGTGVLPTPADGPFAPHPVKAELRVIAIDGTTPRGSKLTVSPGQCLTLALRLRYRNGAAAELTNDPYTTYDAAGGWGHFSAKNLWCPRAGNAGRTVTLFGRYSHLPGHPPLAGKIAVTVRRR